MKKLIFLIFISFTCFQLWSVGKKEVAPEVTKPKMITITDSYNNIVELPDNPSRIICSGPGALRLAVYLGAEERVVAVDDMEKSRKKFDARPYALAHPELKDLPLFGEFRGFDNPELILGLDPQPQVIFKTFPDSGYNPKELEEKTGIPVVTLNYGDLGENRSDFFKSLRIMANILNSNDRADEIIAYLEEIILDLEHRTNNISEADKKSCYIGGIAYAGPHGIQSTEPSYPSFLFINAKNTASGLSHSFQQEHVDVSKEIILDWDPDIIFIDASTVMSGDDSGAIYEITNEEIFNDLKAIKGGNVYGLLPYNWYTCNYGSVLANAYYAGKILYPERFKDVDPRSRANDIYTFLVGKPLLEEMIDAFNDVPFSRIIFND